VLHSCHQWTVRSSTTFGTSSLSAPSRYRSGTGLEIEHQIRANDPLRRGRTGTRRRRVERSLEQGRDPGRGRSPVPIEAPGTKGYLDVTYVAQMGRGCRGLGSGFLAVRRLSGCGPGGRGHRPVAGPRPPRRLLVGRRRLHLLPFLARHARRLTGFRQDAQGGVPAVSLGSARSDRRVRSV